MFDQWPKLQLGLDTLSNQKILNGIYYVVCTANWMVKNKIQYQEGQKSMYVPYIFSGNTILKLNLLHVIC
jgi:hypothetical protein